MEKNNWSFLWITVWLLCHTGCHEANDCLKNVIITDHKYAQRQNGNGSCDKNFIECWRSNLCIIQAECWRSNLCIIQAPDPAGNCPAGNQINIFKVAKLENLYSITLQDVKEINLWILQGKVSFLHSKLRNKTTGSSLQDILHLCEKLNLTEGPVTSVQPEGICGKESAYDPNACGGKDSNTFILNVTTNGEKTCVTCTNPVKKPDVNIILPPQQESASGFINATLAVEALKNITSILKEMGNNTIAAISMGKVKGLLRRLIEPEEVKIGYSYSQETMSVVESSTVLERDYIWSVRVSTEAFNKVHSANKESVFVGVLRFPNMAQDEKNSTVLNNVVYGISMGGHIYNLTDTIDLSFRDVDMGHAYASCNSWNGEGNQPNWTTYGCDTLEINNTITCRCTHLTFFAILMSTPEGNITVSDMESLTYITYIGCGMSMLFLGVALFMHLLIRNAKSNQTTKILVNLFIAMFLLNLTFLANEWVASIGNFVACTVIAAAMHYSMLSTFTWFSLQALHMYLRLIRQNVAIKHYMLKICIPGWAWPALIVVVIIALGKYDFLTINTDDGNSVKMCWITDYYVHYIVNIGYYALVFLFTFAIFIVVVQKIIQARKLERVGVKKGLTSKRIPIILSLFSLLGLTWGVAFFSYGPMVIPSYYIFSILNSFQGFFLFLYYYNIHKESDHDTEIYCVSSDNTSSTSHTCVTQSPCS